jgi:voltage-gated potassium channel
MTTPSSFERWERASDVPLTVAAVAFLAAYAWPIIQPDLPAAWDRACEITNWATWAVFALDYAVRFGLAPRRRSFVRANLASLASVVLPLLRPLRLLRLVTLLHVLNRKASSSLRGRIAVYVTGATALIVFVASLAELSAERGHRGANIVSFDDAWWWAIETVTTVGYGDRYPVTLTGRLVAVGLMLAGIALLGVITAGLASWVVEKVSAPGEEAQHASAGDVQALTDEVSRLQSKLDNVLARRDEARPGTAPGADDASGG